MQVSVVIPVYNAAAYVREAVESALAQPEVAEVVLVEDGSLDNSLAVCQSLVTESPKVRLYQHPEGQNLGAAASRNLAILKSTSEYVAFLDADDFYLPQRFPVASALFKADPRLDGVYEAVGTHIEDEASAQRWVKSGRPLHQLTTIRKRLPSEGLFAALVRGDVGSIHLDGLTVRRSLLEKCGLFDEHLRLHQDSALLFKMAALGRLAPGRLDEAVAMRRIHSQNRISAPRPTAAIYTDKMRFWRAMLTWSKDHLDRASQQLVLDGFLRAAGNTPRFSASLPTWLRPFQKRIQLALLVLDDPALCLSRAFWEHFLIHPRGWFSFLLSKGHYEEEIPSP
ncbi:MAG: glycosyltransferase family 2 protein [candidate division KSB1 bacterium]|nr:glycosyltransferase family 2 protein [candidate division KSB1 bacterium]